MVQQVIYPEDEKLSQNVMGEKPYKVMDMNSAGFSVPKFYTIISDGSGEITIDDAVREADSTLPEGFRIGRSAHFIEGPGSFESIKRINRLVDTEDDMWNYLEAWEIEDLTALGFKDEDEFDAGVTFSLKGAYDKIMESADPNNPDGCGKNIEFYLHVNEISGFNPNDMNMLVMEQKEFDYFAMFVTSDAVTPNLTKIHYVNNKTNEGGVAVYDSLNDSLDLELDSEVNSVLVDFAKTAREIESHFGQVQQVELGYSDDETWVLQSRDIDLSNPKDVARYANYFTFDTKFHTEGYGDFHLPVLVLDKTANFDSSVDSFDPSTAKKALEVYREEIDAFVESHDDYIVVVKEITEFVKELGYEYLGSITGNASVVLRSLHQDHVRHDDWNRVERGGVNLFINPYSGLEKVFMHCYDKGKDSSYANDSGGGVKKGYVEDNVTWLDPRKYNVKTGDYLHVLANADGTFVWTDGAVLEHQK